MERELRDALTRRRHRLHHLALAQPRDARPPAGGEPRRDVGRGAAARRRDGRAERGHLRDRRRGRGPRAGRPGPARLPRAAARPRRRDRAPDHLRPLQPARTRPTSGGTYVALLDETAAAGGRMFAQVHSRCAHRAAVVQDPAAVRPPAGVEGAPRAAARRAEARGCAIPSCAAGWSRPRASATSRKAHRHRGAAADYDWIFVMRHASRGRTARWPRSRASAACDPVEAMIDLALEKDLDRFFLQPIANEDQDHALELMQAPAHGRDLLRLRRPRLADHGLLAADAPAQPLGAREAGVHARAGGAHADASCRPRTGASPTAA